VKRFLEGLSLASQQKGESDAQATGTTALPQIELSADLRVNERPRKKEGGLQRNAERIAR
jgi:hypothetical protein